MKALRISWTETEGGCEARNGGFTFHTSPETAESFLKRKLGESSHLPYDFPSHGWKTPAEADPVEILDGSTLANGLSESEEGSIWTAPWSDDIYEGISKIKPVGPAILIDFMRSPL